ncbi:MAG: cold-shock protein [Candidatus Adlerbacteria bacterium]|nr:cold-shock protein [Candidatus Adlerbacteria bacterium]
MLDSSRTSSSQVLLSQVPPPVSGRIKWFDWKKGFGFVTPEDGLCDAFLNIETLHRGGFKDAAEGSQITFDFTESPTKGRRVSRVISITPPGPEYLPPVKLPKTPPVLRNVGDWHRMSCKLFNRDKGFGFVNRGKGTEDVFLHVTVVQAAGMPDLQEGQQVEVRFGNGPKGLMVAEIRPIK